MSLPATTLPLPTQLSTEDENALNESMRRHPAGKALDLTRCPTCGTRPSGALGEADLSLV